ncbi:hypothetical protein DNX69_13145 [Rhodopseudomonas palustris]|uniref:Uncharacterized protein n=1 Tax=Rhodopseudomonas palustris TaxID=1076 RepID=A0A323UF93_RHOPL|nr:hypothetical protein [Rhodopseudomonas palustris]PZA11525.1 hypothetical protein DNX69_13145 [Rhodopseudomonas palustris]
MTASPITVLTTAVALTALSSLAHAEAGEPWVLSPDMGYGYTRDGKMLTYKMGTSNAKELFKGAKKVPRQTLFFVGANGQLYMRSGPFLEGDGSFKFGADQ